MTTAAIHPVAIDPHAIQLIALEQLEASRNNPRRTMDEADLAELICGFFEAQSPRPPMPPFYASRHISRCATQD